MKKMIMATIMAAGFFGVVGFSQQTKPTEGGITLTEASLSLAKRVCSTHAGADVWIYHERLWDSFPCAKLQPVFDADKENSFDSLIPLIEDLHKTQAKSAAAPETK